MIGLTVFIIRGFRFGSFTKGRISILFYTTEVRDDYFTTSCTANLKVIIVVLYSTINKWINESISTASTLFKLINYFFCNLLSTTSSTSQFVYRDVLQPIPMDILSLGIQIYF